MPHGKVIMLPQQKEFSHFRLTTFEDIKYFADSRGEFRYGHPTESEEFKKRKSIHLLIHPAWWMSDKSNPIEIIQDIIDRNHEMNKKFFRENSIPYREHSND